MPAPKVNSEASLRAFMKLTLPIFNDEGVAISDSTVHNTVLSKSDGFPPSNSMNVYQMIIQFRLFKDTDRIGTWPANWMAKSVADVARPLWKSVSDAQ